MTSASQELTENLFKALIADQALVQALDGQKVFDRVPERVRPPYIVLGQVSATDWSTATEDGEVSTFTLHTWSKRSGKRESHILQTHIKRILTDETVVLPGHHLINLRPLFSEVRRDPVSSHLHGVIRFRGVTEPRT